MPRRRHFVWYIPGEFTTLNDSCSTILAADTQSRPEAQLYFACSRSFDAKETDSAGGLNRLDSKLLLRNSWGSTLSEYQCALYGEAGQSGAISGVNENGVAVALKYAPTRRLRETSDGQLSGEDLVLLALKYGKTALHAAQLLIQFIQQWGVKSGDNENNFEWAPGLVLADARGAWLLETACGLWSLGKVPKEIQKFSDDLYIEESVTQTEEVLSLAAVADGAALSNGGRLNFRKLFAYCPLPEHDSKDSESIQNEKQNEVSGTPLDIATVLREVRKQKFDSRFFPSSNDHEVVVRSGAFVSIITPDIDRRIHLFTCESDTGCAMFKPFFLDREGGASLSETLATYIGPGGSLHQRRRYALERRRLSLESSSIPVLQYRNSEEQRYAYQPAELCERLRFLEMICIEKALTICGYSSNYRQREHVGLCREFEERLSQCKKRCVKMDTKMLFPGEVPQEEWPKLFQRFAIDSKETLFEKSFMREEFEYELFLLDGGDQVAKSRRIRGLQLAPYPGEHFCLPISSEVPEKPDGSMPHLFVYQSGTETSQEES
jgi:hypothetical protein